MLKIIMYTKKQKKSSEGVFSKFLVNLYACCLFPASFQYTSSTFLNPTQLVAIVSLPLFYLLSLKSIYAFHFPHQNVELCFCFSLLVIVKVAATFTLVFEARGSRLSETFRGPKAKKQPLYRGSWGHSSETSTTRTCSWRPTSESVDFRGCCCCCHREVVLEGGGCRNRKGEAKCVIIRRKELFVLERKPLS